MTLYLAPDALPHSSGVPLSGLMYQLSSLRIHSVQFRVFPPAPPLKERDAAAAMPTGSTASPLELRRKQIWHDIQNLKLESILYLSFDSHIKAIRNLNDILRIDSKALLTATLHFEKKDTPNYCKRWSRRKKWVGGMSSQRDRYSQCIHENIGEESILQEWIDMQFLQRKSRSLKFAATVFGRKCAYVCKVWTGPCPLLPLPF